MTEAEEIEKAAKEVRKRTAANLRLLAQQVEAEDIHAISVAFITKDGGMGQLLWTDHQKALFHLIAAIEVSKFDLQAIYAYTACRQPGNALGVVQKDSSMTNVSKGPWPISGDLNDE